MKKLLFILFTISQIFGYYCFAQQYGWHLLDHAIIPDEPNFSDVFFINADLGWFAIKGPFNLKQIYRTVDGGATFSSQNTPFTTLAIQMLNSDVGYAVGFSADVLKTTNGGSDWMIMGSASSTTLFNISFPTVTNPYNPVEYICGNMSVYKIDSIVTNLSPPYVGSYKKISAPSSDNVWMCGETRILHYTNNTFTEPTVPSGAYNDLHFINNLEGWVVGNNGLILYTNNGGASWDVQVNPSFNHLRSVFFLNANEGWTVGDNGRILHTTNGGTDWNIEASGLTSEFLTGVHFTSSINGYVVGEGETILKFGELTAVENEKDLVTGFSLSQNYPNPFNPITNIEFRIANFEFVSLKVYDVLGNEVAVLINEEKPAEKYEVEFNGNDLTSGIYFYQLRSGDYVQTKKMLLIK